MIVVGGLSTVGSVDVMHGGSWHLLAKPSKMSSPLDQTSSSASLGRSRSQYRTGPCRSDGNSSHTSFETASSPLGRSFFTYSTIPVSRGAFTRTES